MVTGINVTIRAITPEKIRFTYSVIFLEQKMKMRDRNKPTKMNTFSVK